MLPDFKKNIVAGLIFPAGILILAACDREESISDGRESSSVNSGYLMKKGKHQFELHCSKCHSMKGEGGNAGPPLDELGERMDGTMIREGIIEPSRKLKEGYEGHVMPESFASEINEEDMDALIFYLTNN